MAYVVAIVLGALVIGGMSSLAVHLLPGSDAGYFFAKFMAGPLGLVSSFVMFIVYDHVWPKNSGRD